MAFPTTQEMIDRAQHQLGAALPASYANRLIRENGGEVSAAGDVWQLFPVLDDSERKRLSRSANHIIRETQVAKGWPGFPAAGLAVGANGAGDLLVLLRAESVFAEPVFWWDHETGRLHGAADSFTGL